MRYWPAYLLLIPVVAWYLVFCYLPMGGLVIAFKRFSAIRGIGASPWVGWENFERLFASAAFLQSVRNTIIISALNLLIGFPLPIIFAVLLNEITCAPFKKLVQTVSYLPHFISVVVLVGMMSCMFSVNSGWVNTLVKFFGGEPAYIMGEAKYFRHVYVWSGVWQEMGWNSIIYLAALTSIDPGLHEAAMIDGAGKLRRIWHIDLPGILPTIAILLIMRFGQMMSLGFDKVYIMQNSLNYSVSEVLSTYIYEQGIKSTKYSYSAAIGLFNNLVNLIMLVTVNRISDKLSGSSLF